MFLQFKNVSIHFLLMRRYNYLKQKYTYKYGIKDEVLKAIVIAAKYVRISGYLLGEGVAGGEGAKCGGCGGGLM